MKLLNKLLGGKRYFIVSYIGSIGLERTIGQIGFITTGYYLNRKLTKNLISKKIENINNIVIINIIELSKSDYKDWVE